MRGVMMSGRLQWLKFLHAGYERTGVSLIAHNSQELVPYFCGDDLGMYYIIPLIAHTLGVSLDTAIMLFFNSILIGGCLLGLTGLWLLYRSWGQRLISFLGVMGIWHAVSEYLDTYIVYTASAVAIVPLTIYYVQRAKLDRWFYAFGFLAGCIIGGAHCIRSFAGVPPLIFFVISVCALRTVSWAKRAALIGILLIGASVPIMHQAYIYNQYQSYVHEHMPEKMVALDKHVFWHAVYLGFGFLNNDLGIKWDDSCAGDLVKKHAPDIRYCSPEYEAFLRNEVIKLIKYHKGFVVKTIFAKIGILFYFLLRYAHIGLIVALFYRKPWWLELAFTCSLAASSLFGLLTVPSSHYLFGFITLAALYGIVSINYALSRTKLFSA